MGKFCFEQAGRITSSKNKNKNYLGNSARTWTKNCLSQQTVVEHIFYKHNSIMIRKNNEQKSHQEDINQCKGRVTSP